MRNNEREKKPLASVAAILTSLLIAMAFALVSSTSVASGDKNVVEVKASAVHPVLQPKVLIFPVVVKEAIVKANAEKADSKVLANRNAVSRNPFFLKAPFFFENPFEELD